MILAGGDNVNDAITRMMRLVWGKDLCNTYNWSGKSHPDKPKRAFGDLKNFRAVLTSKLFSAFSFLQSDFQFHKCDPIMAKTDRSLI